MKNKNYFQVLSIKNKKNVKQKKLNLIQYLIIVNIKSKLLINFILNINYYYTHNLSNFFLLIVINSSINTKNLPLNHNLIDLTSIPKSPDN